MPVYNSERYLKDALDSIISQSFKDFELICVDDGSSDNSLKILDSFESKDSRIKVITQENNGAGAARNNGLKISEGEYIYFMNPDDYVDKNLLELTYSNMISNDSDVVLFKIATIPDDNETVATSDSSYEKMFPEADFNKFTFDCHDIKKQVFHPYYDSWTKAYKKEFLNQFDDLVFDEKLPHEDILFHVKVILIASKISFVPEYLYFHRTANSDPDSFNSENHVYIFDVFDDIEAFLRDNGYFDEFKNEFESFMLNQIFVHMLSPVNEEYFNLAKLYFKKIDYKHIDMENWLRRRCKVLIKSNSSKEYDENMIVPLLFEEYSKLRDENKQLRNDLNHQKKIKKELLSSNSLKYTEPFRKFFNKFR